MKVKICGLTTYEDAMAAVEAGADLLGFNFYRASSRYIRPAACLHLQVRLQTALREHVQQVKMVGVFVNSPLQEMKSILDDCGLDLAQLSGDEPREVMAQLGERAFKALRPASLEALAEAVRTYPRRSSSPSWLIDTYRPGEYGGTGQAADWSSGASSGCAGSHSAGGRPARRKRG